MITIEQVEKLREYANVTYDEAKKALEKAEGDILQAVIDLEQQGKAKAPEGDGRYVSSAKISEEEKKESSSSGAQANGKGCSGSGFKDGMNRFFVWLGKVIQKGNVNSLVVERHKENIIKMPLTILVVLLLVAFWVVIPLLVVGLFFNFRYYFEGPDVGDTKANKVMDSVAKAAEDIKSDIKSDQSNVK